MPAGIKSRESGRGNAYLGQLLFLEIRSGKRS